MSPGPPEMFTNFLCVNCNKYLSVGPIRALDNGSSICGKCKVSTMCYESTGFDYIMDERLFPSCFDRNGCKDVLKWGEVFHHEQQCKFQNINHNIPTVSLAKLQNLTCTQCKGYLNEPPVRVRSDKRYLCGRCPNLKLQWATPTCIRDISFENALKKLTFPCENFERGCVKPLSFGEARSHELTCAHRLYKCQIYPERFCSWIGTANEMKEHFQMVHPECVIEMHNFQLDIQRDHRKHMLITFQENELFLLFLYVNASKNELSVSLRYIGNNHNASLFLYSIKVNTVTFDALPVLPDNVLELDVGNSLSIPIELTYKFLKNASVIEIDCCLSIERKSTIARGILFPKNMKKCPKLGCDHVGIERDILQHQLHCPKMYL